MLTPGPFSLPMTSRQAFALEALLKSLPDKLEPRRLSLAQTLPEPDTRSDISWITTERRIVRATSSSPPAWTTRISSSIPIVTLNHDYTRSPVGRSLWRKPAQEGSIVGIKAKTYYPPRPKDWSDGPWLPDLAHGLLHAGLLNAKSIGFLPLKVRSPSPRKCAAPRPCPRPPHRRTLAPARIRLLFSARAPLAVVTDIAPASCPCLLSSCRRQPSLPPPKFALFNCQLLIVNRLRNRKSLSFLRLPPSNACSINEYNAPTKCTSAWFKMGTS